MGIYERRPRYHGTLWNDKEPLLLIGRRRWTSVKIWSPSINMIDRFLRGTQSNKQTKQNKQTNITSKQNKTKTKNNKKHNKTKQTNITSKKTPKPNKQTKPTNRPYFVSSLFLLVVHMSGLSHLSRSLCDLMSSQFSNYCQCVQVKQFSSNL